jgi:hypothetical protein
MLYYFCVILLVVFLLPLCVLNVRKRTFRKFLSLLFAKRGSTLPAGRQRGSAGNPQLGPLTELPPTTRGMLPTLYHDTTSSRPLIPAQLTWDGTTLSPGITLASPSLAPKKKLCHAVSDNRVLCYSFSHRYHLFHEWYVYDYIHV